MRDAKRVWSGQWVFLVCDASQVPRGHGGCPMPLGQVGGASRPNVGVILSGEPTVIAVSSIEFPFVSHVSIAPYG